MVFGFFEQIEASYARFTPRYPPPKFSCGFFGAGFRPEIGPEVGLADGQNFIFFWFWPKMFTLGKRDIRKPVSEVS